MKKTILGCTIGIIIGMFIMNIIDTKGENNNIGSNGVIYENNTTVKSALDNLYSRVDELTSYGNATSSTILSGYTALVKGKQVTGSYTCPTCDYSNYVAKSNITSKSGTENVSSLGGSSTTLNGYYNLSNYKVSCPSGYSSCSSCCSSCTSQGYYSSCSSCCSSSTGEGTYWKRGSFTAVAGVNSVYVGFTPSAFYWTNPSNSYETGFYNSYIDSSASFTLSGGDSVYTKKSIPNTNTSPEIIRSIGSTVEMYVRNQSGIVGKTFYWIAIR